MELDETKASVVCTQASSRSSPCKMQFYLIHSTVNINTHNLHGYLDGKENKNVRTFSFVLFTDVSSSEIMLEYRNADCRLQHIHEHDVTSSLKGKREKTF